MVTNVRNWSSRVSVVCLMQDTRHTQQPCHQNDTPSDKSNTTDCAIDASHGKRITDHLSNWFLILGYEIWIPAIKFFERISQVVSFISLRQESINQKFMAISKILIVCTASRISDKLWDVYTIRRVRWYITWHKWNIDNVKIEVITLVIQLGGKFLVGVNKK